MFRSRSNGVASMDVTIPDTITTWVIQAFSVGSKTGLGVAKPYDMIAFKLFFVQLNLPYSMIRGEQVMLSATVFNFGKNRALVRREIPFFYSRRFFA